MKLTLNIKGEKKTFFSKGITMRSSLLAYELSEGLDKRLKDDTLYSKEHIEELAKWLLETFDHQFTLEEMYDGCEESFFALIPEMLKSVVHGTNAIIQDFPNAEAPETT